jgi:hypothetical protein
MIGCFSSALPTPRPLLSVFLIFQQIFSAVNTSAKNIAATARAAMRHHDKLQIIAFFAKLVFTSLAMMNEAPAGKGARVAVTRHNPGRERRA